VIFLSARPRSAMPTYISQTRRHMRAGTSETLRRRCVRWYLPITRLSRRNSERVFKSTSRLSAKPHKMICRVFFFSSPHTAAQFANYFRRVQRCCSRIDCVFQDYLY
jgi:hypothetical protein